MRTAALVLLLALAACSSDPDPASAPSPVPRVDSALCDDLRVVVRDPEPDTARRVLVALGPSSGAPEDVVVALHEVQAGAPRTETRDAVLASYVERDCGGL